MTAPSLNEIREIQRIESEKISEAIRSGNIEGLRVSYRIDSKLMFLGKAPRLSRLSTEGKLICWSVNRP